MDLKNRVHITRLIFKYLTEDLSGEEGKELEEWIHQSGRHRRYFREWSNPEVRAKNQEKIRQYDVRNGWNTVLRKRTRRRFYRYSVRIAASVLILLGGSFAAYYTSSVTSPGLSVAEEIQPGRRTACLIMASGEKVGLDTLQQADFRRLTISQEEGTVCFRSKTGPADPSPAYHRVEVPRGGEFAFRLPDGTTVFLNAETQLRFPEYFVAGEERAVYLSGEAYFDVVHDEKAPFVVYTENTAVKVLGTSFNVMAYPSQDQEETTLVKGAVLLSVKASGESVRLSPGQQGCYHTLEKTLSNREVETSYFTFWKEGVFAFYEQPLEKVMETLSRWYMFEVVYRDQPIKSVIYTGKIARHASIQEVLHILELLDEVQFEIQGHQVIVSKK